MSTRLRLAESATRAAIERYAEQLAAEAPPLSDEMKQELRTLLNPPQQRARVSALPAPRPRAATKQAA